MIMLYLQRMPRFGPGYGVSPSKATRGWECLVMRPYLHSPTEALQGSDSADKVLAFLEGKESYRENINFDLKYVIYNMPKGSLWEFGAEIIVIIPKLIFWS